MRMVIGSIRGNYYKAGPHEGFSFTKGFPVIQTEDLGHSTGDVALKFEGGTRLYDFEIDLKQENSIWNSANKHVMLENMVRVMNLNDAPVEQYRRIGLGYEFKRQMAA